MKILWISHFLLYPDTGYGALQRSRGLLLELCKKHEVTLVSCYRDVDIEIAGSLVNAQRDLEKHCASVILVYNNMTRNKKAFDAAKSILTTIPYSVSLYRSSQLEQKIMELFSASEFDVMHSDTLGLTEFILDKIPDMTVKVLNHHNIESNMMLRRIQKEQNPLMKLFLRNEWFKLNNYEKRFCQYYDVNLVVSDIDGERLHEISSTSNTVTIENAVDCDYFTHHLRSEESSSLIFTGSLDWYPNADAMIYFCRMVWPSLLKRYSDITLTIIGKNPPDKLRLLVEGEIRIQLKGRVEDVRPYVAQSRVFICPIRDGGGTRLKILDALAQGIPVVSTDIGCEGINILDGENILIANTSDEFISKISFLMSDLEACNKLSLNGRKYVEDNYSFNTIGSKLSDLYEHLVSKRKYT
jgi:polysaccharide biosynthesis protein PslH